MDESKIVTYGLLAIGAYVLYQVWQNSTLASAVTASTTSFAPIANTAGNEFSCPSGTSYYPSAGLDFDSSGNGNSASGGGYCA